MQFILVSFAKPVLGMQDLNVGFLIAIDIDIADHQVVKIWLRFKARYTCNIITGPKTSVS